MTNKYAIKELNFDVTRRCNLSCNFCARGRAQETDITPDVIDATFNQLRGKPIYKIRLSGGEPLIAPTMVEYIIDSMIHHEITTSKIYLFTNAILYDNPVIDAAFVKAAKYIDERNSDSTFLRMVKNNAENYHIPDGRVQVIVSDYRHDNADYTDKAIEHYNTLHPGISAVKQTESFSKGKNLLAENALMGLAVDNIRQMVKEPITLLNVPLRQDLNQYDFIFRPYIDYDNYFTMPIIGNEVTVSTNGNVCAGCLPPYDQLDTDSRFNILTNETDLFDYLDSLCWQYPVTEGMNIFRQMAFGLQTCRAKGLEVVYQPEYDSVLNLINKFENVHKAMQIEYPNIERQYITLRCLVLLYTAIDSCGLFDKMPTESFELFTQGIPKVFADKMINRIGRYEIMDYFNHIITMKGYKRKA